MHTNPFFTSTPFMPLKIKDNLVEELIEIIKFVNWFIQKQTQDSSQNQSEMKEFLDDIHTKLCSLMTAMISSPLSGRMFLPMPREYLPEDVIQRQLNDSLGIEMSS